MIDTPQAIAHHRFDDLTHREVPPFQVLVGCVVEDVANGEFVAHASDKAEVISDVATVEGLLRHDKLL